MFLLSFLKFKMLNNGWPSKRKIIHTEKSFLLPCQECRRSCKDKSVQCSSCCSFYHYTCQGLISLDVEYLNVSGRFECTHCIFAEKDFPGFNTDDSLRRLQAVSTYLALIFYAALYDASKDSLELLMNYINPITSVGGRSACPF